MGAHGSHASLSWYFCLPAYASIFFLCETKVPSAKAWHIDRIVEAMDYFVDTQNEDKSKEKVYAVIEYVLIANINDSDETAHELGGLLRNRSVFLNVIPYNPTEVPYDYK
jgi:sorting nexin-8